MPSGNDVLFIGAAGAGLFFLMNQDNEPGEGTKIWPLAVLVLLFWV